MMNPIRRIGVLTGGGDCPGLNAVIRAVVKSAIRRFKLEVVGIEDGFQGLIENRMHPLSWDAVSHILNVGGTILGTNNKVDPRRWVDPATKAEPRDVTDACLRHIAEASLDALVVIGGDGTMTVASHFVNRGVNCVGVPKTIDNDLEGTDVTFGFSTAVATACEALDRIRTTAASHHRAMVVEVMGRNAGWLALHSGVACGADVILIPEVPYDIAKVCEAVLARHKRGRNFTILCVSEGAKPVGGQQVVAKIDPTSPDPVRLGGVGALVAAEIEKRTCVETRVTVLGHVQRGGTPNPDDRVLATRFGHAAIELLASGATGQLVVMQQGRVKHVDLDIAAGRQRLVPLDSPLVQAARDVGTSFGD
jgi:ATP-dependent phosphofructokinase / diphosphate-dependent phosphofructokinase